MLKEFFKTLKFTEEIITKVPRVLSLSDVGLDWVDAEVHDPNEHLIRGQRWND